jgi:hypothetical protein
VCSSPLAGEGHFDEHPNQLDSISTDRRAFAFSNNCYAFLYAVVSFEFAGAKEVANARAEAPNLPPVKTLSPLSLNKNKRCFEVAIHFDQVLDFIGVGHQVIVHDDGDAVDPGIATLSDHEIRCIKRRFAEMSSGGEKCRKMLKSL